LRVVRGGLTLAETVDGRDFTVAADGFWQVHRQAPSLLSGEVIRALPDAVDSITDLYCGVGLLGITAARAAGHRCSGSKGSRLRSRMLGTMRPMSKPSSSFAGSIGPVCPTPMSSSSTRRVRGRERRAPRR